MRRIVLTTLLVLGFVGPALAATMSEPRVALVIGDSAYRETQFANPAVESANWSGRGSHVENAGTKGPPGKWRAIC